MNEKGHGVEKQEILSTCIQILKEPAKEPVKEPERKPVQCAFSLYVSEKLAQFDKRTRTVAENRISNILFYLEVNSIPPAPINPPPPINHHLPINPPLPISVPRPTNPDPAGNVQMIMGQ